MRKLTNDSGNVRDSYISGAFGRYVYGWGTTTNPYQFGAAWGYIADPSAPRELAPPGGAGRSFKTPLLRLEFYIPTD